MLKIMPFLELLEEEIIEFKNIIEFGALIEGRKEVVRLVMLPSDFVKLSEFFNQYYPEFFIKSSTFVMEEVYSTATFDRFQRRIPASRDLNFEIAVFVGSGQAVNEAWKIEEEGCQNGLTALRYGYPNCCGISYTQISNENHWLEMFLSPSKQFERFDFLANRFASIAAPWLTYHFDYFPCSVECEKTKEICRLNREMLKRSDLSEFVSLTDDHLNGVLIIYDDSIWYIHQHELSNIGRVFNTELAPLVRKAKISGLKLKGLRLESTSASALINSEWLHTDSGKIGIYAFNNKTSLLS